MWRKSRCCRWAAASPRRRFSARRISRARPRHPDGQGQRRLQPLGSRPDAGQRNHAGSGGRGARRCRRDYIAAIGEVLAGRGEGPRLCRPDADAADRKRTGGAQDAGGPGGIHTARVALVRAIARAHRPRLAQLYEAHARYRRFQPGRQGGAGGAPCAMRRCAISPPQTTRPRRGWPMRITAAPPT